MRNSLTKKMEHGVMIARERSHEGRILRQKCQNWLKFTLPLRLYRLTPIMHRHNMHYIAHADTTRAVPEKPRDQTGAPRTRIGVQPPAPLADPNGTDGTDPPLHRRHRRGMPAPGT